MTHDWERAPLRRRWPAGLLAGAALVALWFVVGRPFVGSGPDGRLQLTTAQADRSSANYSPARGRRVFDRAPAEGVPHWTRVPDPALAPRRRPILLWTGDEVLVLGGEGRVLGAAWNPSLRRWRRLADAPLPLHTNVAVWTGQDAVIVVPEATLHYRPDRDEWRLEPEPPEGLLSEDQPTGDATVLGDEVVVVGTGARTAPAYDVRRHRWRTVAVPAPDTPVDRPAVIAHGSRVALFGDTGKGSVGWSVDVDDGTARPLPTKPWPPDAPALNWFRAVASAGDRFVIAQNGGAVTRAAVIRASGWRPLTDVPGLVRDPTVVGINAGVVVWSGEVGRGAIYRRSAGAWQQLDPAPLLTSAGSGVAMGNRFFLWADGHAAVWSPGRD